VVVVVVANMEVVGLVEAVVVVVYCLDLHQ
jgi:hypothetical protein